MTNLPLEMACTSVVFRSISYYGHQYVSLHLGCLGTVVGPKTFNGNVLLHV